MADKVEFELVSPERLLMSRAVEMVVVPGVEGDFGVLADVVYMSIGKFLRYLIMTSLLLWVFPGEFAP